MGTTNEDRPPPTRPLIIDACVLINMHVTGALAEILDAIPVPVLIADRVFAESRIDHGAEPGSTEREDIRDLVASGRIVVASIDTDEEAELFVDLAVDLGDGEAMTLALALARGFSIASDDRRAVRILAERMPLYSTLDLIAIWAMKGALPDSVVKVALEAIRIKGRYAPGKTHPRWPWWRQILDVS